MLISPSTPELRPYQRLIRNTTKNVLALASEVIVSSFFAYHDVPKSPDAPQHGPRLSLAMGIHRHGVSGSTSCLADNLQHTCDGRACLVKLTTFWDVSIELEQMSAIEVEKTKVSTRARHMRSGDTL